MANIIYHVLTRGVDKRKIFMDDNDRLRFIHDLIEFNDIENASNLLYHWDTNLLLGLRHPLIENKSLKTRENIVDIYAFCLMNNHYHLLISPRIENGLPLFMKKLNTGYANYFNKKYERAGALFEGRYKRIPITSDAYLIHLPYYIHLNPLDYFAPRWREREISNFQQVKKKLELYRWSSHLDYIGQPNFPSVTNRKFLLEIFGGEKGYQKSIYDWLKEIEINDDFGRAIIEK